jgi:uncharacterized membrane protein YkoI
MNSLVSRLAAGVIVALLVLLGASSRADEEKVPLDKVPKAVVDAVKAKYPGAKLLGAAKETEKGKTTYEVALKHKGHKYEVALTAEGTILEVEKEIAVKDLPKAIKEALTAKYAKATLKTAEEIHKGDKLTYEVHLVTVEGQRMEVVLDPSGKVLHEERQGKEKGGK